MKLDQLNLHEILNTLKIFNSLDDYKFTRFHMPGHKGIKEIFPEEIVKIFPQYDVTETLFTDDLLHPKRYIKEFMDDIKSFFDSDYVFLSLQGSTHLLQSSIANFCEPYDTILINRDAHKSIYSIAKILKLDIEFIYPKYDKDIGIFTYIDINELENILKTSKSDTLIITSPSYYGINQDIKGISSIAKKYNKVLIVDQAHGAHFKFIGNKTALQEGADICIMSLHKTLPCPNQSALLLSKDNIDIDRLDDSLKILHTSSPSYVLLAFCEYGFEFSKRYAKTMWDYLISELIKLVDPIKHFTNYKYSDVDRSKLLIDFSIFGISQNKVMEILQKYSIIPEILDDKKLLFYFSFIDCLNNLETLKMFFYDIIKIIKTKKTILKSNYIDLPIPKKEMKIYEAANYKRRKVYLKDAKGFVCAKALIPYPPGFPVAIEGEIISDEVIEYMLNLYGSENVLYKEVEVIDEW